jgi:predicted phage terminase large subunit-like protein
MAEGLLGTEAEIRRQREVHYLISAVLVEDKANGSAVVQRLRVNISGVVEINPQGRKIARMSAAAPEWQSGDWVLDRNAAWTEPFIEQITMFPNARNDDMVDMMSQASAWLLTTSVHTTEIYRACGCGFLVVQLAMCPLRLGLTLRWSLIAQ